MSNKLHVANINTSTGGSRTTHDANLRTKTAELVVAIILVAVRRAAGIERHGSSNVNAAVTLMPTVPRLLIRTAFRELDEPPTHGLYKEKHPLPSIDKHQALPDVPRGRLALLVDSSIDEEVEHVEVVCVLL